MEAGDKLNLNLKKKVADKFIGTTGMRAFYCQLYSDFVSCKLYCFIRSGDTFSGSRRQQCYRCTDLLHDDLVCALCR